AFTRAGPERRLENPTEGPILVVAGEPSRPIYVPVLLDFCPVLIATSKDRKRSNLEPPAMKRFLHNGNSALNQNSFLSAVVTKTNRYSPINQSVRINRETIRSADFVMLCVAFTNRVLLIIFGSNASL